MTTINVLTNLVHNHETLVYFLIFLGLIFEGELVLIFTGIFIHLGALSIPMTLIFILAGGLGKIFLGYSFGSYLCRKFNHNRFFRYVEKRVLSFIPRFREKPFWSIFISKFIFGADNLVVLFSGYQKINYKTYLKAETVAFLIWAPIIVSLGYFFSYSAFYVSREVSKFSLIVILLIVVFLFLDKLFSFLYGLFEDFRNLNGEK